MTKLMLLLNATSFLVFTLFSSVVFAKDPIETGIFNNKAIYGYDTVAYFTQNKAIEGVDS